MKKKKKTPFGIPSFTKQRGGANNQTKQKKIKETKYLQTNKQPIKQTLYNKTEMGREREVEQGVIRPEVGCLDKSG